MYRFDVRSTSICGSIASTSPTWPRSTRLPPEALTRFAVIRRPSLPLTPPARPPWREISSTISLLITPPSTISTISIVSLSVTRTPSTKRGSLPRRFIMSEICGPPPWTMTGLSPMYFIRTTSSANPALSASSTWALPPYLMTRVLPANARIYGSASTRMLAFSINLFMPSQDVPAEILVFDHVGQVLFHVGGVDDHLLLLQLGRLERHGVQEPLHHGEEPAGADVLGPVVRHHRDRRDLLDRVGREREVHALGREHRDVLADQRVFRLGQDPDEVLLGQRFELHAQREPPLQLGNQVGGFADVERPRRDEQDVVGLHRAVLGVHGRALDDRQQIALHSFARHVGPEPPLAPRDLVDLVQKDDAVLLGAARGLADHLVHVDELLRLLLLQDLPGLGHAHFARLLRLGKQVAEHLAEAALHLLHADVGDDPHRQRRRLLLDLDLDRPLIEPAGLQLLAQ